MLNPQFLSETDAPKFQPHTEESDEAFRMYMEDMFQPVTLGSWDLMFFTPWKINMEPTNHPFRKENDLPNLHDYVPC